MDKDCLRSLLMGIMRRGGGERKGEGDTLLTPGLLERLKLGFQKGRERTGEGVCIFLILECRH